MKKKFTNSNWTQLFSELFSFIFVQLWSRKRRKISLTRFAPSNLKHAHYKFHVNVFIWVAPSTPHGQIDIFEDWHVKCWPNCDGNFCRCWCLRDNWKFSRIHHFVVKIGVVWQNLSWWESVGVVWVSIGSVIFKKFSPKSNNHQPVALIWQAGFRLLLVSIFVAMVMKVVSGMLFSRVTTKLIFSIVEKVSKGIFIWPSKCSPSLAVELEKIISH